MKVMVTEVENEGLEALMVSVLHYSVVFIFTPESW